MNITKLCIRRKHMKKIVFLTVLASLVLAVPVMATPTPPVSPRPTDTPAPTVPPTETPEPGPITPPGGGQISADLLSWVVAIGLSLAFSYIPGLQGWYDPLPNAKKQAIMGLLVIVAAAGVFGLSCAGIADVGLTCDKAGAVGLVVFVIEALVVNQAAHRMTKREKVTV